MNDRRIFSKAGIALEIIGVVAGIAGIIVAFVAMGTVTEVPLHYDFAGNVDRTGGPLALLELPAIMFAVNLLVAVILHLVPVTSWNLPVKIKPGRELAVYRDMALILSVMEAVLGLFAFFITLFMALKKNALVQPVNIVFAAALVLDMVVGLVRILHHNR